MSNRFKKNYLRIQNICYFSILKRTAAILLASLFLFNWFGYRLFVSYLDNRNNSMLEAQFDKNNYSESDLISIKIPATHLSYYTNSKSFDRVDGQIEINGSYYKYVKRRLYNDSVELLCVPDRASMQLQNAVYNYFKITNDIQNTNHGNKDGSHLRSKHFSIDFFTINYISLNKILFFSSLKRINGGNIHFSSPLVSQPDRPPQIS